MWFFHLTPILSKKFQGLPFSRPLGHTSSQQIHLNWSMPKLYTLVTFHAPVDFYRHYLCSSFFTLRWLLALFRIFSQIHKDWIGFRSLLYHFETLKEPISVQSKPTLIAFCNVLLCLVMKHTHGKKKEYLLADGYRIPFGQLFGSYQ